MPDALRILIVRLSAIGDCVHTLPVLCALRRAYPQAHVEWAVEGRTESLLLGHRDLSGVIPLRRGWLSRPAEVAALRRRLRSSRFDVALDVQSLTRSALVAWISGAPQRIGFAGWYRRELSPLMNNVRIRATKPHVIEQNLELLSPLDIVMPEVEFQLPDYHRERETADAFIRRAVGVDGFAVLNPGAGWPSKRWPTHRYGQVARHLRARHALRSVVVWAGADERRAAEQIVSIGGSQCVVAPETSLRELAELCRRASLFVGADTGPLHLAAAVGTPCVGICGPMPAARNGPYGPRHAVVEGTAPTRILGFHKRSMRSILSVSSDAVSAACDRVLGRTAVIVAARHSA